MPKGNPEARLLAARGEDGGWPYLPGRTSRAEPTALAALALDPASPGAAGARAWLRRAQSADGSFRAAEGATASGWPTPLAMLALRADPAKGAGDPVGRGARYLIAARPAVLQDTGAARLSGALRGWAWTSDAFSWVEPTATAVLALKKCSAPDAGPRDARLGEAEAMLRDRMCEGGGWNFGNPAAFGVPIRAFPVPTALALIALQDRAAEGSVARSIDVLRRIATAEPSMLGLGWVVAALRVLRAGTGEVQGALARECVAALGRGPGPDVPSLALATLALAESARIEVLRL